MVNQPHDFIFCFPDSPAKCGLIKYEVMQPCTASVTSVLCTTQNTTHATVKEKKNPRFNDEPSQWQFDLIQAQAMLTSQLLPWLGLSA